MLHLRRYWFEHRGTVDCVRGEFEYASDLKHAIHRKFGRLSSSPLGLRLFLGSGREVGTDEALLEIVDASYNQHPTTPGARQLHVEIVPMERLKARMLRHPSDVGDDDIPEDTADLSDEAEEPLPSAPLRPVQRPQSATVSRKAAAASARPMSATPRSGRAPLAADAPYAAIAEPLGGPPSARSAAEDDTPTRHRIAYDTTVPAATVPVPSPALPAARKTTVPGHLCRYAHDDRVGATGCTRLIETLRGELRSLGSTRRGPPLPPIGRCEWTVGVVDQSLTYIGTARAIAPPDVISAVGRASERVALVTASLRTAVAPFGQLRRVQYFDPDFDEFVLFADAEALPHCSPATRFQVVVESHRDSKGLSDAGVVVPHRSPDRARGAPGGATPRTFSQLAYVGAHMDKELAREVVRRQMAEAEVARVHMAIGDLLSLLTLRADRDAHERCTLHACCAGEAAPGQCAVREHVALEDAVAELQRRLRMAEQDVADSTALRQQRDQLRAAEARATALGRELQASEAGGEALRKRFMALEEDLEKARRDARETMERSLAAEKRAVIAEADADTAKQRSQRVLQDVGGERDELLRQAADAKASYTTAEGARDSAETEAKRLRRELVASEDQRIEAQARLHSLVENEGATRRLAEELTSLQKSLQEQQADVARQQREAAASLATAQSANQSRAITDADSAAHAESTVRADAARQVQQLEARIHVLVEERRTLEAEALSLRRQLNDSVVALRRAEDVLSRGAAEQEQDSTAWQNQAEEFSRRAVEDENEAERVSRYNAQLKSLADQAQRHEDENFDLRRQLEQAEQRAADLAARRKDAEAARDTAITAASAAAPTDAPQRLQQAEATARRFEGEVLRLKALVRERDMELDDVRFQLREQRRQWEQREQSLVANVTKLEAQDDERRVKEVYSRRGSRAHTPHGSQYGGMSEHVTPLRSHSAGADEVVPAPLIEPPHAEPSAVPVEPSPSDAVPALDATPRPEPAAEQAAEAPTSSIEPAPDAAVEDPADPRTFRELQETWQRRVDAAEADGSPGPAPEAVAEQDAEAPVAPQPEAELPRLQEEAAEEPGIGSDGRSAAATTSVTYFRKD